MQDYHIGVKVIARNFTTKVQKTFTVLVYEQLHSAICKQFQIHQDIQIMQPPLNRNKFAQYNNKQLRIIFKQKQSTKQPIKVQLPFSVFEEKGNRSTTQKCQHFYFPMYLIQMIPGLKDQFLNHYAQMFQQNTNKIDADVFSVDFVVNYYHIPDFPLPLLNLNLIIDLIQLNKQCIQIQAAINQNTIQLNCIQCNLYSQRVKTFEDGIMIWMEQKYQSDTSSVSQQQLKFDQLPSNLLVYVNYFGNQNRLNQYKERSPVMNQKNMINFDIKAPPILHIPSSQMPTQQIINNLIDKYPIQQQKFEKFIKQNFDKSSVQIPNIVKKCYYIHQLQNQKNKQNNLFYGITPSFYLLSGGVFHQGQYFHRNTSCQGQHDCYGKFKAIIGNNISNLYRVNNSCVTKTTINQLINIQKQSIQSQNIWTPMLLHYKAIYIQ